MHSFMIIKVLKYIKYDLYLVLLLVLTFLSYIGILTNVLFPVFIIIGLITILTKQKVYYLLPIALFSQMSSGTIIYGVRTSTITSMIAIV